MNKDSFQLALVKQLSARWVEQHREYRFAVGKVPLSLDMKTEFDQVNEVSRVINVALTLRIMPDENDARARVKTQHLDNLPITEGMTFTDVRRWINRHAIRSAL